MINRKELAICKRRGHEGYLSEGWKQCKWCKTWVREVRKIEEREDEPPEEELDAHVKMSRLTEEATTALDRNTHGTKSSGAPMPKKPRAKNK